MNPKTSFRAISRSIRIVACGVVIFVQILGASDARSQGAREPNTGRRFALIVGVSDYSLCSSLHDLSGADDDAKNLSDVLVKSGVPENQVTLMCDGIRSRSNNEIALPTKKNITGQLGNIIEKAKPNDELLVTIAGHGVVLDGESYFCPSGVEDPEDPSQLILVKDITKQLEACQAEKKLLIVDACRDETFSKTSFVSGLKASPKTIWLLSTCSEGQKSHLSPNIKEGESHFVFSYYLAEGLRGKADLLGNPNGQVSLCELYAYVYVKTQDEVERLGGVQTPELFGSLAPVYDVLSTPNYVTKRELVTTGDPVVERRYSAALISDLGIKRYSATEDTFREQFVSLSKSNADDPAIQSLHQDFYNQLCYALGNYLTPAVELDPESKLGHLGRGLVFRTCGLYAEALQEFTAAEEHFDLFVKADPKSLDKYLEQRKDGQTLTPVDEIEDREDIPTVELRRDADGKSDLVAMVPVHSKVRIAAVAADAEQNGVQWLKVSAVNDKPLDNPGWIRHQDVIWFAEAADLYLPESPMRSGGGMPPIVSQLEGTSRNLHALAQALDRPAYTLSQIRQRIYGATRGYDVARGILGQFGVGLPDVAGYAAGPIAIAEGYASIPGSYVRTVAGYVEIPASYARMAATYAGYVGAYQAGMYRAMISEEQRQKLLEAATLQPVRERPIRISLSPWSQD